ncbi:MAG TPA: ribonuclease HII [Myxococcota bacterium]|nr:ribonuclease HII [Myxococcota bacterium]HQP96240.1 ribonuclease HII [Myxococcota bacterium]
MKKQNLLPDPPSPGPGFVEAWAASNQYYPLVGVDEAGRGCLAGPVSCAAVILPLDCVIPGLDDSKALSPAHREDLYDQVIASAVGYAVTFGSVEQIESTDILKTTLETMGRAVRQAVGMAGVIPKMVVVDGNRVIPGLEWPQTPWIKGDHLSMNCAAASILAKVTRDRLMCDLDATYPGYGFMEHKGYGTKQHMDALRDLGPCPIHRRTFAPVRTLLEATGQRISRTGGTCELELDL